MICGNTFQFSKRLPRKDRRRWNMLLANTSLHLAVLNWASLLFHLCAHVCVGWQEVGGGTQCHLKRSAWRHSIRNITPWYQARFYKHSLNDTQLAAWRQLSLPSLRPNVCLSLFFPPLSHSGVQLGCLPSSSPPPPFRVQTSWSRSCKKLTSCSWCSLPFLFVGLPVLPLWSGRSELTLWERLPDAQTAGEIIPSFCFGQVFFFYLSSSVSRGLLFPLYCFSIYLAKLQVYFRYEAEKIWPPRDASSSEKADLGRTTSQGKWA